MSLMLNTVAKRRKAGRRAPAIINKGATLIEVLVSMLVLAVGILGMNALQTSSMKSNQNAYMRMLANSYALDIVERLTANGQGNEANNYDEPTPAFTSSCLTQAGCTAAQMAANDVAEWQQLIATNLPMGTGIICLDTTPDDGTAALPACDGGGAVYAVKIWWDDDRSGTAARNLVMTFR